MTREERRRQREAQAELEAIADEVAAELGDWGEPGPKEPGQIADLQARRDFMSRSRGMIVAAPNETVENE